jgi:hypothetical protein
MDVAGGLWSAAIHGRFGLRTKRFSLSLQAKAAMNSRTPKRHRSLLAVAKCSRSSRSRLTRAFPEALRMVLKGITVAQPGIL